MAGPDSARDSAMESLYPFLYAEAVDLDAVLDQARRSTEAKIAEIVGLRERVAEREAERLAECARAMARSFAAGGQLLAFGNGGSSTDAQDLAGMYLHPAGGGRALPALSLTSDVAVVTALSNDVGFEVVFARQLAAFGRPGDIALALSTSGNSDNLIAALREATRRGMVAIALAGHGGGQMAELPGLHHLFVVPSSSVHRIQEAQTTIYQVLWELTREAL
jgi:D-sedoheptulose 7-phosphate isomerase